VTKTYVSPAKETRIAKLQKLHYEIFRIITKLPSVIKINILYKQIGPTPVAALSETWFFGRLLTGIAGSNPAGGMDVCIF
jgi:hypothetical protein